MSFSFHPEAQTELEEAFEFYRENGGLELAKDFVSEVGRVAEFLVSNPGFGATADTGLKSYPTKRFPYMLVYEVDGEEVLILAVGHQHRLPGYLRRRRL
jgi:plasmid stabilization system protein ParE